jgi:prepilin-type N-terminal cleavage/methylation domain-containing protein
LRDGFTLIEVPVLRKREAFTLVEVLIAIVIAAAMVGVAASSLITSLRAEESALRFQEAGLAIQAVTCDMYMFSMPTGSVVIGREVWDVAGAHLERDEPDEGAWSVIRLSPRSRPSVTVTLSFQKK